MPRRPNIGVTGPDHGGTAAWLFSWLAIRRAGGVPVRLRPSQFGYPVAPEQFNKETMEARSNRVAKMLPSLDAVIIGGGADIEPSRYGAEVAAPQEAAAAETVSWRHRAVGWLVHSVRVLLRRRALTQEEQKIDARARDQFEDSVIRNAREQRLPLLGICRGMQMLTVVLGGRLHQELNQFYLEEPNPYTPLPCKTIDVDQSSMLYRILQVPHCRVNALHRQAVSDTGPHLRVCARETNGVVQAVEATNDNPPMIGVQYHPEYLPQIDVQQRIFSALVASAREHMGRQE